MSRVIRNNWWLSGNASIPNPNDIFGNDLKLWINGRTSTNKTTSGVYNSEVSTMVSDDATAKTLTKFGNQPLCYNGSTLYWPGIGNNLADLWHEYTANRSDFKFMHDGSAFTVGIRCKLVTNHTTATSGYGVIMNTAVSSASVGFIISYDNRIGSGFTNALVFQILRGAASQPTQNVTLNNFFVAGQWVDIVITYTGTTLKIFKNGVEVSSTTDAFPNSTADHSFNLTLGKQVNATAGFLFDMLVKDIILVNALATSNQLNQMYTHLANGDETLTTRGRSLIYMFNGQSNMGQVRSADANWGIESSFITNQQASTQSTLMKYQGYTVSGASATVGPDNEFAYQFFLNTGIKPFISKVYIGGTPLYITGASNDWNVDTNELADFSTINLLLTGKYAKHKYGLSPEWRGACWRQGETDANIDIESYGTGSNYKGAYQLLIKQWITDAVASGWFDVIKPRFVAASIDNADFSPVRPFYLSIVSQTQQALDEYLTAYPSDAPYYRGGHYFSTSDLPLQDGSHFQVGGYRTMGQRFFDILEQYINE